MNIDLPPETIELKCGAIGYLDGIGYRCGECLAIWGSIGCRCSNDLRKLEKEKSDLKTNE